MTAENGVLGDNGVVPGSPDRELYIQIGQILGRMTGIEAATASMKDLITQAKLDAHRHFDEVVLRVEKAEQRIEIDQTAIKTDLRTSRREIEQLSVNQGLMAQQLEQVREIQQSHGGKMNILWDWRLMIMGVLLFLVSAMSIYGTLVRVWKP